MSFNRDTGMPEPTRATSTIDNLDEKEYDMRLSQVADLGTQESYFKDEVTGETKYERQAALLVEVIGETVTLNEEEKARSLWLKPFKMAPPGKGMWKDELALYKVFDPKATKDTTPNWEAQLGKPCSGMVVNVEGKGKNAGKVFDNVANLSSIPEKYQADIPPATIETAMGDADDPKNIVTAGLWGLPKYVHDKRIGAVPVRVESEQPKPEFDIDDDIPF